MMACPRTDCSYLYNASMSPPALQANPDISGIGVLIGFVGMAYITLIMLLIQYLMGMPEETTLDDQSTKNPVDKIFLDFVWQKLKLKPPERWAPALKSAVLALSDTQIVTGISILASGYSQLNCGLSIFHWQIVVYLAWFSSITHLTTLTFLRRFIHKNRGVRKLRLVLIVLLVIMLAFALVPTGGSCGMQNAENHNSISTLDNFTAISNGSQGVYPGSLAACCMKLATSGHFIGGDSSDFLAMLASELILITSSITRVLNFFTKSSTLMEEVTRQKPSRWCKNIIRKLEKRYTASKVKGMRFLFFTLHCVGIIFILVARAVYDLAGSMLWEISWLIFSLGWGTMQLFILRGWANTDSSATQDDQQSVVLQENFWGFGQLTATILLILPLLSLVEGFMGGSEDSDDAASQKTSDSTISLNTLPSSGNHRASSTVQLPGTPPQYVDPYSELNRSTNTSVVQRTGTDLVNMEERVGDTSQPAQGALPGPDVTAQEETQPHETDPPLRSTARPWPAETFYDHDFYMHRWYQDLVVCLLVMAWCFAVQLIIYSGGVSSSTIWTFIGLFQSWFVYTSLIYIFILVWMFIAVERRPERLERLVMVRKRLTPAETRVFMIFLRICTLAGLLGMTSIYTLANFVGFGFCSAVIVVLVLSSWGKSAKIG